MQGCECSEGKSKLETGVRNLGQGSRIRARNGEGRAGLRCGVLETETKVSGGAGYAQWKIFNRAWVVEMLGLEFRCGVTRSVTMMQLVGCVFCIHISWSFSHFYSLCPIRTTLHYNFLQCHLNVALSCMYKRNEGQVNLQCGIYFPYCPSSLFSLS